MIGFDKVCEIFYRILVLEEVSKIEIIIDREGGLYVFVKFGKNE